MEKTEIKPMFKWGMTEKDFGEALAHTEGEDEIYGQIDISTITEDYIIDVFGEHYPMPDRTGKMVDDFDLEIWTLSDDNGHGENIGSIRFKKSSKGADTFEAFKEKCEKLLTCFIQDRGK